MLKAAATTRKEMSHLLIVPDPVSHEQPVVEYVVVGEAGALGVAGSALLWRGDFHVEESLEALTEKFR